MSRIVIQVLLVLCFVAVTDAEAAPLYEATQEGFAGTHEDALGIIKAVARSKDKEAFSRMLMQMLLRGELVPYNIRERFVHLDTAKNYQRKVRPLDADKPAVLYIDMNKLKVIP